LIDHFVKKYASKYNGSHPKALTQEILDKLTAYHWPGNVRELQNVLKRLMVFGVSDANIDEMLGPSPGSNHSEGSHISAPISSIISGYLDSGGGHLQSLSSLSLKKIRKETENRVEKAVIGYVLEKTGWNRSKASRILQISYKSLLEKIQVLNITPTSLLQ